MKCYIDKGSCKKGNTEICNGGCRAYILMEAIYEKSNVPKKYRYFKSLRPPAKDLDKFKILSEFKNEIEKNVEEGNSLYLYSRTTGNGKTSWACKIAGEYIKRKAFSKQVEHLIYYVNVPELLEELRCGYESGEYTNIINHIKKADLVIFDDIGAERATDWVRERLYSLINYRNVEELATIFTSNLNIEELSGVLGSRIGSRLSESLIVELSGNDRRVN